MIFLLTFLKLLLYTLGFNTVGISKTLFCDLKIKKANAHATLIEMTLHGHLLNSHCDLKINYKTPK